MTDKDHDRRSVLRMSGSALAAASGLSLLGNTGAASKDCPDCGGGGGGGGGGGTGSPPSVGRIFGPTVSGSHVNVSSYLSSMGDDDSVSAWFNWGPEGEGLPNYTRHLSLDSTGTFCDGYNCSYDSFGSLDPGTYEVEAYVSNSYGSDTSPVETFTI
ncbi:hypothetical protein [Halorussus litoreus]|uniref:hypothetical protein n=1 Tax=Halorussus litoreus TaxID=1710536 RepID=UPI000E240A21|nr:hypothetical protein [Halorussus litoreus]